MRSESAWGFLGEVQLSRLHTGFKPSRVVPHPGASPKTTLLFPVEERWASYFQVSKGGFSLDLKPPYTGVDNFQSFLYWLITLFINFWSKGNPCPLDEASIRVGEQGTKSTSKRGQIIRLPCVGAPSHQAGHRCPQASYTVAIWEARVLFLLLSKALSAYKCSFQRCLVGVCLTSTRPQPPWSQADCSTSYFNKVSLLGVPCANRVTWKLGYMQSLFWADSIKSYGSLLSDEEADRADRVPAAEHKPENRDAGCQISLGQGRGVRRRWNLAYLSFYPSWWSHALLLYLLLTYTRYSEVSGIQDPPKCRVFSPSLFPWGLHACKQDWLQADNTGGSVKQNKLSAKGRYETDFFSGLQLW